MDARRRFTARRDHRLGDQVHFAEVTIHAEPCTEKSEVVLTEEVLGSLREVFGRDFDHQRHCLWSAVIVQIDTINVKGKFPHAGATFFRAEVVDVRVSSNAGRDLSAFLLSVAGMDAIQDYRFAWEDEQKTGASRDRRAEFERVLNKIPDAEPDSIDRLPKS